MARYPGLQPFCHRAVTCLFRRHRRPPKTSAASARGTTAHGSSACPN